MRAGWSIGAGYWARGTSRAPFCVGRNGEDLHGVLSPAASLPTGRRMVRTDGTQADD